MRTASGRPELLPRQSRIKVSASSQSIPSILVPLVRQLLHPGRESVRQRQQAEYSSEAYG
jgi:hypothetical protein